MEVNYSQIGVKYFLDKVECKSQYGKLKLKNLPILCKTEIESYHELLIKVIAIDDDIKSQVQGVLGSVKNISLILKNVLNKQVVDLNSLHEIKVQAMQTQKIINLIGKKYFDFEDVDEIIKILDPNQENKYSFRLYECYDLELNLILKKKRDIEHQYYNANYEDKVKIMQARDKVVLEEKVRTDLVIKRLVTKLSRFIDKMIKNCDLLTDCDVMIAKSLMYKHYNYCKTEYGDNIEVENGVYPFVCDNVRLYTPLSIELFKGSTLITGANMGGKSTILKNLAFNITINNLGFLPLASKFVVPEIKKVLFLHSFEDSSHGLSRFGNEIVLLNKVLDNIDKYTLFLVDEFASSTNPTEGYIFVKSLINYCNSLDAYSLFTSHYDNLSSECQTYVVLGLNDEIVGNINDSMNYNIYKTSNNIVPRQALKVAKHLEINSKYLKILKNNYRKE
ncbi:MAG: MutS-related protein [Bacilli bacterium]